MISDASLTNMLLILVACAVIGAVLIAFLPPDDDAPEPEPGSKSRHSSLSIIAIVVSVVSIIINLVIL